MQGFGDCLVAGHLDESSFGQHLAIDTELCSVRVRLVEYEQLIGHVGSHLRVVRQPQGVFCGRACGDTVHDGIVNVNLGNLHLHRTFHDENTVAVFLIIFRIHRTLVGSAGLATPGAENRSPVADAFIDINREGIVSAIFRQCEAEGSFFLV